MADSIQVCVAMPRAYDQRPLEDFEADVKRLKALDPRITIEFCGYADSDDVRTLRGKTDIDAARRATPGPSAEQRAAYAKANVILTLDLPYDMDRIAPNLRWVQSIGAGVGQLQTIGLDKLGAVLTSGAGVASDPIAEFVLARILAHWKLFPLYEQKQRKRDWTPVFGRNLAGSTLGIVGHGAIGQAIAWRGKAWGMKVLATKRRPGPADPPIDRFFSYSTLHDLLAQADAVVLCAPETSETTQMFNKAAFAAMKPGSFFCNVARGSLVDEAALIDALSTGHLSGAAIDVAAHEPLPADDPLWSAPNLAISPHSAASLERYFYAVWTLFIDNMSRFLKGETLKNICPAGRAPN